VVKHQNILGIITIGLLAIVILLAKLQKHPDFPTKPYSVTPVGAYVTIAYGSHIDDGANLLDLYLPSHSSILKGKDSETSPLIVFIHGGAWQMGDKSMIPDPSKITKRGYVVASINYRLTKAAPYPAQIEDCKTAVNWLREHAKVFKIAPDHIGVWGVSAGGHLAALLGTTGGITQSKWGEKQNSPCTIQAVADWCGPTNLTTIRREAGSHCSLDGALKAFLVGMPEQKSTLAKEASPVFYVCKGLPPFLIMHGDNDITVPVEQSKEFAAALKAVGSPVDLQIMPGKGHYFFDTDTFETVLNFFDLHLKKES